MSSIQSSEYWTRKGEVELYLYRKRLDAPGSDKGALPVLFLVHGSSFCGRSGFDMHPPGHDDYSLMDEFAARGFDVWTMDHEGYGRSSRTNGNSNISLGKCRSIVNSIAGHGYELMLCLQVFHYFNFLMRQHF